MVEARTRPPIWRVALAFLLAPAAAALVSAGLSPAYAGLPDLADRIWRTFTSTLLFGGYPVAIVLGVPAFFALKDRLDPTALNCALVGATISAVPWLLVGMLSLRVDLIVFVAQAAALGCFAGLVFWVVAAFRFSSGR